MKSRFQREQRTRIVFQKQKRTAKVQNFQENSLAFPLGTVRNYGASWKVEWAFYGTFNGGVAGGCKKERKGQIFFFLNQGRIENPAKSRRLFSQKSFIVDIWQGSEYSSNSEYNTATPRSYYSLWNLLFKLITPWLHGIQKFTDNRKSLTGFRLCLRLCHMLLHQTYLKPWII